METMKKLVSADELRQFIEATPQMKLRIASALSEVLRQENVRLSGKALGSLSFSSYDELEKMGVKPPVCEWTI